MGTFDQKLGNQLAPWKRHLQGHAAPTVSVSVKNVNERQLRPRESL